MVPPTLHQTLSRAAREPHRSTLDPDRGYYGEAPMGLRRYAQAVGGAFSPITGPLGVLGILFS
jgi:hypothetical protein